jgi:hypothetical protein
MLPRPRAVFSRSIFGDKTMSLTWILGTLFSALFLAAWLAVMSLPGIGIVYLSWKLSCNIKPNLRRAIVRAGFIAVALTPSFWGHGLILPAIVVFFMAHGRDRLLVTVCILVVWVIAIAVLSIRGRRHELRNDEL